MIERYDNIDKTGLFVTLYNKLLAVEFLKFMVLDA